MSQIKVLQVLYGGDAFGGVENFLLQYYSHMDRTKIHFDFAFCRENSLKTEADNEVLKGSNHLVLAPGINNHLISSIVVYSRLKKYLKKTRYDFVHINTGNIRIQIACLLAAKHAGISNRIAHSHSSGIIAEKKGIAKILYNFATRIIYNNATLRAGCSEQAAKHIFGQYLSTDDLTIIPIAVDAKKLAFNGNIRQDYRVKNGINDEVVFIQIGNFYPVKNHAFSLKVFDAICKKTDNCRLWLVGGGELLNDISEEVKTIGLDDKVTFMGFRHDVPSLLQAADCLLLPSFWEGFPTVVLEAQSADLKCICNETITHSIKVTDKCSFIPLDLSKWVEECLQPLKKRENTYKCIVKAGYDIGEAAQKLQTYYFNNRILG